MWRQELTPATITFSELLSLSRAGFAKFFAASTVNFIVFGENIRRGTKISNAWTIDIVPTLLYLMGLPGYPYWMACCLGMFLILVMVLAP